MSKAFCCDNCGECYQGNPCVTDSNGNDFCHNCIRVLEAMKMIDPFIVIKQFNNKGGEG